MADTIPTSGVSFTEDQLVDIGLTGSTVSSATGDTLVIAASSKTVKVVEAQLIDLSTAGLTGVVLDGVKFTNGLTILGSTTSADTLAFGGTSGLKTSVKRSIIDLGVDNIADTIVVASNAKLKRSVIQNFGAGDSIVTKKGTFTAEDVNDKGKIKGSGLGSVRFEIT